MVVADLNERGALEVADDATARGTRALGLGGDVVDRARSTRWSRPRSGSSVASTGW